MADRNPVTGRFLTRPANSGRKKGVKAVKRWFVRPRRRRPPRCGCACHETSACHGGATVRRRLEEAAGVEEATQSTETPLEFLLRKMRDTAAAPADRWRLRHSAIRSCRQWLTGFVTGTATNGRFRISSATLRERPSLLPFSNLPTSSTRQAVNTPRVASCP